MNVWIREADGTGTFALWPTCDLPHGFITENRKYEVLVRLNGSTLPESLRLSLNDVPIDGWVRAGHSVFPFETEFYAGTIRICISKHRRVVVSIEVEIDPDIAKLTRDEYVLLVSETARATLALYRLSNVSVAAPATIGGTKSDLVTLELVRLNFDRFMRSASRIADQPIRTLRSTSAVTDIRRARKIDDQSIKAALRSDRSRQASAAETQAAPKLVRAFGGKWVPSITENHRVESVNVYEHRALLGFARWLDITLGALARRIERGNDTEARFGVVDMWLDRLSRWRSQLQSLARRSLFSDLTPESVLKATNTFRMHPDYASAYVAMSRMRAGFGTATTAAPSVPVDRTYKLYELWCYINILLSVAERFPALAPQIASLLKGCSAPNALGSILAQGAAGELRLTPEIRLTYQKRFSPTVAADGTQTRLIDAIPDITFTRIDSHGRCLALVVIDPKYRVGASLMDGVRDLHVYRDAILDVSGARVVRAATALAPRTGGLLGAGFDLPRDYPGIAVARPGFAPSSFNELLEATINTLGATS